MARTRISQAALNGKLAEVNVLCDELGMPRYWIRTGNKTHEVPNYLFQSGGQMNVWPEAKGGHSLRDAYQALELMRLTLTHLIDAKENGYAWRG